MFGAGCGGAPRPDSLMLSMSSESTTERLCSSPAMARSKAFCFTILLHSWYFILASLSWGFTFTTWAGRQRKEEKRHQRAGTAGLGQRSRQKRGRRGCARSAWPWAPRTWSQTTGLHALAVQP